MLHMGRIILFNCIVGVKRGKTNRERLTVECLGITNEMTRLRWMVENEMGLQSLLAGKRAN